VRDRVEIGGVEQPVIGQRKNETEIRLREGEVNILGGLSQDQQTRNISGIPGLVNIPVLRALLGSESTSRDRGQLLIAIIPHIVRTPNYSEADLKAVASGTDQTFKVAYAPRPSAQPTPAQPAATPPPVVEPKPADAAKPPIPGVPNPAGGARLMFLPPNVATALGGQISVSLQAESMTDLFSANPIRIKFDPRVLRLNDIIQGEFLGRDGQRVNITRDIRNDVGEASVTLTRLPGATGVTGAGVIATFTFSAIGRGAGTISVTDFGLKNTQQQPVVVTPPELQVNVQ